MLSKISFSQVLLVDATPRISDASVRDFTCFGILILAAYSVKREIDFPKSLRDAAAVKIGQLSNDYSIR